MISRRQLIGAGVLACAAPVLAEETKTYTAGKEYLLVNPSLPVSGDKIEVVEFFAYTCPHCLQFQPFFRKWAETAPADVTIRVCPVAWNDKYLPFSETYYAIEALGMLDKLHTPFFESVIYQTREYSFENARKEIQEFMISQGVNGQLWEQTVNSFTVRNKARLAMKLWESYQIDSTPMIGVGGRFTTGPHLVGSRTGTPDCISFLVNECRR